MRVETAESRYEIRSLGGLICMSVAGRLTLAEVWRLNTAFWSAWQPEHDRILMDYTGVREMRLTVKEFTGAGVSEQIRMTPRGDRMRAAYVAGDPVVYGFTRVIQNVWSSHLAIETFDGLRPALEWLEVELGSLTEAKPLSSG